jgi:predicted unusual protein kinase regulating ubiquinone biosynthesis (AarF/ABC1/UbiB family)
MATRSRTSSAAAIKRHRTTQLASLATRAYYFHRRGQDDRMYDLICVEFVALGGVYIKFLQGVMLQSSMMKRWHSPDRLKVFENLDHEPIDIVAVLRHELSPKQLSRITLVQPQPFAAGSFGQVYYAQLDGDKPIIIKVLRPMVRELLRYDLRLLSMFSRSLANKLSPNMDVDLDGAIKDFRNATLRETDYVAEAAFAHELYEVYRNHPKLLIPETYMELSTPNLIVQEYVPGISVAQLIRLQEQGVNPVAYVRETLGSDLDAQLEMLGRELIGGIFYLDRIQGDPHPGNVRLLPGNRVGLIDFGIAAPTPKNKAAFYGLLREWGKLFYSDDHDLVDLFQQFMRFFVSDLYRALKTLSNVHGEAANDDYVKSVGNLAKETFSSIVGTSDLKPLLENGRALQIINDMVNKDNRFGLTVHLESSEILRAAQTYISLIDVLGRRKVLMPRVFDGVVASVEQQYPDLKHQSDESMSIADALETVSKWLERVATRDPALFRQLMNRIRLSVDKPRRPAKAVKVAEKEESNA